MVAPSERTPRGTMDDPGLMAPADEEGRRGVSQQQDVLIFSSNVHEPPVEDESPVEDGSPVEDEITADVTRGTTCKLREEGDPSVPKLEEGNFVMSSDGSVSTLSQPAKNVERSVGPDPKACPLDSEFLPSLRNNPEDARFFGNFDLNAKHGPLAASGAEELPEYMVTMATDMVANTDSEEIQKLQEMAWSLNEKGEPNNIDNDISRSGLNSPQVTPEMVKMTSGEDSDISLKEIQNMLQVASSVNTNDSFSPRTTTESSTDRSRIRAQVDATGSSSIGSSGAGQSNCGVSFMSSVIDQLSSSVPTTIANLKVLVSDLENVNCGDQGYNNLGSVDEVDIHGVSPEGETATDDLSNVNGISRKEGVALDVRREAEEAVNQSIPSDRNTSTSPEECLIASQLTASECSHSASKSDPEAPTPNTECLQGSEDNSEAIRLSGNHVSNTDLDSLAALGIGGISAEIVRTAQDMFCTLDPEELQKMFEVAFSLNVKGPMFNTFGNGSRPGLGFPEMTPETIKMSSDIINKLAPEELQKMLEVAPSLNMDAIYSPRPTNCSISRSKSVSVLSVPQGTSHMGRTRSDKSFCSSFLSTPSVDESSTILSTSTADLEENIKHSIQDPTIQRMLTSMMNDMSPEMMTNMNEQFGLRLQRGDGNNDQEAMPSISEDDLDRMMQQEGQEPQVSVTMEKTTIWFLGKAGLNLAFCMLILAFIFHKLGYIRG